MNDDLTTPYDEAVIRGMERSVNGIDITSMIEKNAQNKAQMQSMDQKKMQEAMRFYEMAQKGDLVPRELIPTQQPTQQTYQAQQASQQPETAQIQQSVEQPVQNTQSTQNS